MSLSRLRWHRHVLWALCVTYPAALLAQEPAPAPSADAAAPDDPEKRKEEAKVRFQRGLELVQNESWDAALAEFLASRKLFARKFDETEDSAVLDALDSVSAPAGQRR